MLKHLFLFFILFFLSLPLHTAWSFGPLELIINEIAWMGTTTSANDEWVELYNNTQNSINLDGWQLTTQDGTPKITLSGIIPANGFYLLERTNDDTMPGISSDKIYTGALGNGGEYLKLYDNLNNIVDEADCSTGWFTGDNSTKQTMERAARGQTSGDTVSGWQTSENPGGTPKSQNRAGAAIKTEPKPTEEEEAKTTTENQETPQESPGLATGQTETNSTEKPAEDRFPLAESYPIGIVFNEILPSPEGPDETEEWIEIFNQNNFEVDLTDWKIQDTEGKITTYTISNNTKVKTKSYLILTRPQTKITLNNTGDKLTLLRPDRKIIDIVVYEKSPQGQSYNRINTDWSWSNMLTPGSVNIVADNATKEKQKDAAKTKEDIIKSTKITASLNQIIARPKYFLFIFLIALGIATSSVITFFFFKRRNFKK